MSPKNYGKGKHLTAVDRLFIEEALKNRLPLTQIANYIMKDTTTISKEIKLRRTLKTRRQPKALIACDHRKNCNRTKICSSTCILLCKTCINQNCLRICSDYKPKICRKLTRYPHVCNGCETLIGCSLDKFHYKARIAEEHYRCTLTEERSGLDISEKEFEHLDNLISPLILRGQSLAHIHAHHYEEIGLTIRTLYNYFDKQFFTAKNIDLPRKVRYKPRKKNHPLLFKNSKHRVGRNYEDFCAYIERHPEIPIVEMDTVHGKNGGKVLLTLFFRSCSLMIAFIMQACTKECVKNVFDDLYERLGSEAFRKTFPLILTDNGSEFMSPEGLENDDSGEERTRIYYCNPMASYQKPHIEKNHEFIRYILPKSMTFDKLSQADVTLMMNHINSTARASRNGCNPFRLAQILLDKVLLESLDLRPIPPDEVLLKPALLKK